MTRRSLSSGLAALAACGLTLLAAPAVAKKQPSTEEGGTRIFVRVLDAEARPIPTAVIRHPEESDRHRVNSVDGTWDEEILYLPDGSELLFTPGMLLYLEVSAPGYQSQIIQYQIRRRGNQFDVVLTAIEEEDTVIDAPTLQFGTDAPREESGGAPAH